MEVEDHHHHRDLQANPVVPREEGHRVHKDEHEDQLSPASSTSHVGFETRPKNKNKNICLVIIILLHTNLTTPY